MNFSSKADVLHTLSCHADLHIPPLYVFTVRQWRDDAQAVLSGLAEALPQAASVAVRSSCRREDSASSSGAGAFLSLLDVAMQADALAHAANKVIASYGTAVQLDDQVLVQPMLNRVTVAGVIMTRVLTDGTPYYVINYDDHSGKTDTITGGNHVSKTVFVYRGVRDNDFDSSRLHSFVALARRVEELCASDTLDIEFCLDADNVLHLLQVRPICTQQYWQSEAGKLDDYIPHLADFIREKTNPTPDLYGQSSILGVMPDWNPAEMIGILPRPLASSLYRNLITARVWSSARERMGYKALPATELMYLLLQRPYIDVRASFNSLLPADLDAVTAEALVSAWLERLEANPQFHDKVEFDIAQTVLDFCFDAHMDSRYPHLLTQARREHFRSCLHKLTVAALDLSPAGSMARALDAVTELRNRQAGRALVSAEHPLPFSGINALLAECRKYGTLPFAILARHAFMAESLLRTAVAREALSPERMQAFKLSVTTIAGEMSQEFVQVCNGQRDAAGFMRRYGHLRPGSYDILSPRYADRKNLFGDGHFFTAEHHNPEPFSLTEQEHRSLAALLHESRLPVSPEDLFCYARRAIAGRELAKFVFSRNLSDALEGLALWGAAQGFDREAMSFMDLQSLLDWNIRALPDSPQRYFQEHMAAQKALFAKGNAIKLGYLIRSVRDVFIVPQHRAAPNFIGSAAVEAPVVRLSAHSSCDADLTGKIVCIENADPGFDWIFTRRICGLITQFGGANSHMAIRCAEYGLPAAIGVGEQLFTQICTAAQAFMDPYAAALRPC